MSLGAGQMLAVCFPSQLGCCGGSITLPLIHLLCFSKLGNDCRRRYQVRYQCTLMILKRSIIKGTKPLIYLPTKGSQRRLVAHQTFRKRTPRIAIPSTGWVGLLRFERAPAGAAIFVDVVVVVPFVLLKRLPAPDPNHRTAAPSTSASESLPARGCRVSLPRLLQLCLPGLIVFTAAVVRGGLLNTENPPIFADPSVCIRSTICLCLLADHVG